jgi:alpha-N-arabinofuranosidase
MRQVDPDLLLLAVGVPTDQFGHWNERVLSIAGGQMDMLSMHWYSLRTMRRENPPPPEEVILPQLAAAHEVDFILRNTLETIAQHSDPPVPLAFDEWNTYIRAKPPLFLEDYNVADALYTGGLMNACIRMCNRIKMSAPFNFINVMGNYRVTSRAVWPTPATLVLDVFTRFRGPVGIDCQVTETPTFSSPEIGQQFAYDNVPTVDAAATYDPELGLVYLSVVNHDREQAAAIRVDGLPRIDGVTIYQVSGNDGTELNTEEDPSAVAIQQSNLSENAKIFQVPPLSFSMVVVKAR